MNTFKALINIMPLKELLDPQGKTLTKNMQHLNLHSIEDIRVGKRIQITLKADSYHGAEQIVEKACKELLANMIMESYEYEIAPYE